jgi:hypothetical protein
MNHSLRKLARCLTTMLGLALFGQLACAAEMSLLAPPRDLALKEPADPPPPGGPFTYAITEGSPNWHIVAWNIPGGKLPPFVQRKVGESTVFGSQAAAAAVEVVKSPNGRVSYRLSQDGSVLPCEAEHKPRESDLFAAPNDERAKPPEGPAMVLPQQGKLLLPSLSRLVAEATVTVSSGSVISPKGCDVSQGGALISIILNNAVSRQTLFYQVKLSIVCGPQPRVRTELCTQSTTHPRPFYFSRANPFGVDDPLPMFGQKWIGNNERRTIKIDVLPRLVEHIEHGPSGMDHDPSHWDVGKYYNGQHIWGDVTVTSQWEDIGLIASSR